VTTACEWDTVTCSQAALGGDLGVLQWLREHDIPSDAHTIRDVRTFENWNVVQWVRENGCPEPMFEVVDL